MVSFHSNRRVAMLLFLFEGENKTLQLATVMHAISASLLRKIDLSKRRCANGIFFNQRYRLLRDLKQTQILHTAEKSQIIL